MKSFQSLSSKTVVSSGSPPIATTAQGRKTNTIHKKVLTSSPVFCSAKYRGGVRKDGGVTPPLLKKLMKSFQSLSSKLPFPRYLPYCDRNKGDAIHRIR